MNQNYFKEAMKLASFLTCKYRMRVLYILSILLTFISCKEENKKTNSFAFLYTIDTIRIDSHKRILDLDGNILKSDFDNKSGSFLLFNSFDHSLDEINLDILQFEVSYPFEIEGPNGTGKYINSIKILKDGSIFIKAYGTSGVFNKNGKLINKVDWQKASNSITINYERTPRNEIAVLSKDLNIFGLSFNNKEKEVFLDVLSKKYNIVKRFNIDSNKSYKNFVLSIDDPSNYTYLDPYVYLNFENEMVMISHQFSNEIYLFNPEGEFLNTIKYNPKKTLKRASDVAHHDFQSFELIQEEYQKLLEQIQFGPIIWDNFNNKYYRLSASRTFNERKEEDALLPELKEVKVFLSVFDSEFNLIAEVKIDELNDERVKYFAKDGKLWVAQNFNDELCFLIIDLLDPK